MIFEDATNRRWRITRRMSLIIFSCVLLFSVAYLYSSRSAFALPVITSSPSSTTTQPWLSTYQPFKPLATTTTPANPEFKRRAEAIPTSTASLNALQKQPGYFVAAFLTQSDPASLASFKAHADRIDIIMPDWYSLPDTVSSTCVIAEHIDEPVRDLLHQHTAAIFPRFSNTTADSWSVVELRNILRSPARRSCLAVSLTDAVRRTDSKGLNIDIEGLSAEDRPALTEFLIELTERLRAQQQLLTIDIPVDASAFDLPSLSVMADAIILMAYDQHYPDGRPGPIAAQDWVKASVQDALRTIPPEKLILGTGNYSYDWTIDTPNIPAHSTSFADVMQLAKEVSAKPEMQSTSQNFQFGYQDAQKQRHEVWFLDANSLWNQHLLVHKHTLLGASLWRLGLEDPGIWSFLGQSTTGTPSTLETLSPLDGKQLDHPPEIFSLSTEAVIGRLQRQVSNTGEILAAQYLVPPTSYTLERIGKPIQPRQLVLSFAQNLDPVWTPKILDLLNQQAVPAIFSLTGDQIAKQPALAKEIDRRGLLFRATLSPTIASKKSITGEELYTELNRTQREIVSTTGKKTALFQAQNEVSILPAVTRLGYLTMDSGLTIQNNTASTSLPLQVAQIRKELMDPDTHLLTMRTTDGEYTVELLTLLIPEMKSQGYTFASLDKAAEISINSLQLPASLNERFSSMLLGVTERMHGKQWLIITWIFFFTNVISLLRILFLGAFVLKSKHEKTQPSAITRQKLITVVIPAFNEAKTIRRTLSSVQHSTHTNFIALVVNDGSTDRTAAIVEQMRQKDPRIQLLNKPNGGKFSALNLAFQQATTDLIVTIDADTILHPKTLDELLIPFEDPRVDAVCGNVEVGNVHNLLTGFQALEYITTQNFDRRAFEALNCIGVVPGATGAWRRESVLDIGGYEADTLVEDADVTLRLLQYGGKIVYAPEARSRTEAPATLKDLSKQRLRWSFGTFQCLSKHAKWFFHGTLGWITLPNIFFFQILYPILSPIGDLVFLWALVTGQVGSILQGYLFFILIDFAGSALAFHLEKRSPKLLLLIFIQRFFYRQFMYIIAFRSILAILRGTRQGWNKLARAGSVHTTFRKKLSPKLAT